MKKISYNDVIYDIPESIDEFTLEQWIDLYSILKEGEDLDMIAGVIRIVDAVTPIPLEVIEEMSLVTIEDLLAQIPLKDFELPEEIPDDQMYASDMDKLSKKEHSIVLDGEEFYFQPDPAFTKAGVMRDVEQMLAGKDLIEHLHYLMAIAFRRKDERFDMSLVNVKAKRFLKVPIGEIKKALFFFASNEAIYSFTSKICFKDPKAKELMGQALAMSFLAPSMIAGAGTK